MTVTVNDALNNGLLSQVTYADFSSINLSIQDFVQSQLMRNESNGGAGFTASQASDFLSQYRVVDPLYKIWHN